MVLQRELRVLAEPEVRLGGGVGAEAPPEPPAVDRAACRSIDCVVSVGEADHMSSERKVSFRSDSLQVPAEEIQDDLEAFDAVFGGA